MRPVRALPLRRMDAGWWATIAVALLYLALCASGALQTGSSWDEDEHRRYGEIVLDFYRSFGRERAAVTDEMSYYGALHALVGTAAERLLPALPWPSARHLTSVAFSFVGLIYCARLARLLGGRWAGLLAALLLAATPRWTGDAMFNPIDIPAAGLFMAALYYLARIAGSLESARPSDWLRFGVAAGLTLGVRLIGVLLLPYAAVLIVAWWLVSPRPYGATLRAHGPRVLAGFALATAAWSGVALALWPRLMVEPVRAMIDTFAQTHSHPWYGQVLFQGTYYGSREIPRAYLPVWLWITTPIATMLGGGLALAFWRGWLRSERGALLRVGILAFGVLLPPLYAIVSHAVIYDGIRHFLFVVPPLTAIAAAGWAAGLATVARWRRWALVPSALVLGGSLAEPIVWYARSHPHEYVYFNPLAGGLERASHAFDTDYWGLSLRAAAETMAARRLELVGSDDVLVVVTNANWHLLAPWLDDPAKYRLAAPGSPFHLLLLWCRGQEVGWELAAHPLKRGFVVRDQVPFWQMYPGPLTLEGRSR